MKAQEHVGRTRARSAVLELRAKCTTCKTTYTMTEAQRAEAREMGCAFSPCCGAVATVEMAAVRTGKRT
jgi:hypothetical protein